MASEQYKTNYETLTVDKCFSNHYVVPEYQREYVWEESNIEQLLADLIAAYESQTQKPYFMGMMVVYTGKESTLELVDGQQRITTFFLLLSAVAHIYQENNDDSGKLFENKIHNQQINSNGDAEDRYALDLQYETSSDCLNKIFHKDLPSDAGIEKLPVSDQRLYKAYDTIMKILRREFSRFPDLKKFAAYVLMKVEFVQIQTVEVSDALKIFETINERGVGLNPMDLLKNMIFMNVRKDQFTDLNKEWKKLISCLETAKEKPLRFLRYFISSTYDVTDPKTNTINGILPEDSIYDWLTHNDKQCDYTKHPFEFVELLNQSATRYSKFLSPNSAIAGDEYLKNISCAAGTTYRLHLVLLMAAVKMDDNTQVKFKQILESVVYYLVVNSVKANETEKVFAAWCPQIREISNQNELKIFAQNIVIPQINKWKTNHNQHFMAISLNSMQKYRIRYILARTTKYVDDVRGGGSRYADIEAYYDKKNQIEHIMPQTCDDCSAYGVGSEEFNTYVSLLGNLTLLEKTYNVVCQNKPYTEKGTTYQQSQFYLTKSLPGLEPVGVNTAADKMNNDLVAWATWNKQAIIERQEMLYRLSEKIWSIDSYVNKW